MNQHMPRTYVELLREARAQVPEISPQETDRLRTTAGGAPPPRSSPLDLRRRSIFAAPIPAPTLAHPGP